jgi:hypothetical protein
MGTQTRQLPSLTPTSKRATSVPSLLRLLSFIVFPFEERIHVIFLHVAIVCEGIVVHLGCFTFALRANV